MKWTDIWQPPFWYDHYGYVFAKDNVMVFTVEDLTEENDKFMNDLACNISAVLNGHSINEEDKYKNLEIKDGWDLYMNDEILGSFRGWGHLTGGLKLSYDDACAMQNDMMNFVLSKIRKND